jgi:hypothetical protein
MSDFWWKLPVLRGLSPHRKGVVEGASVVFLASLGFAVFVAALSVRPDADTLRSAAEICATLLIAYAIEVSWLIRASRRRDIEERESRLGAFTAVGAAAALAVLLSLVLSDRVEAGHWILVDDFGLGWVIASLILLGTIVVMQPWVTHEWMYEDDAN